MPLIQHRVALIICTLASLLSPAKTNAEDFSAGSAAEVDSEKHEIAERNISVSEWFNRYDQIRRDAEMTFGDKLQSLLLAAKKPERKNAALASRMIEKYTAALSEMKALITIPETKELQAGYIEYFSTARQLFVDYLDAQKEVPFTNKALMPNRKTLEELDTKNKELDDALRTKYIITRHRHS